MFRIHRVIDDTSPRDREAVRQVQVILKSNFGGLAESEIEELPLQLRDPVKHKLRYLLLVADNAAGKVQGFALVAHAVDHNFLYLDFISAARLITGRGIGGALYSRVREEARALKVVGIFMECLPDNPDLVRRSGGIETKPVTAQILRAFWRLSHYQHGL